MINLERDAIELASILRAEAPMGDVVIQMPVGEQDIRVTLRIRVRGATSAAEYRLSPSEPHRLPLAVIAKKMIHDAQRLAGA